MFSRRTKWDFEDPRHKNFFHKTQVLKTTRTRNNCALFLSRNPLTLFNNFNKARLTKALLNSLIIRYSTTLQSLKEQQTSSLQHSDHWESSTELNWLDLPVYPFFFTYYTTRHRYVLSTTTFKDHWTTPNKIKRLLSFNCILILLIFACVPKLLAIV